MTIPQIKGYCPGALRPMRSGDGLVVRIRPFNGRLSRPQADGIASLAAAYGNGMIDLSSRGNIQIRGVTEASYGALIERLDLIGLLDESELVESRRNILVTPFWVSGDETKALSETLTEALKLHHAPDIPGKFGFAIDTGPAPVLQTASADIRLERDATDSLILCADSSKMGKPVTLENAVPEVMALASWFMESRTAHKRMAALLGDGVRLPSGFNVPRQTQEYVPEPNISPLGAVVGLAFGQLPADTLASLAKHGGLRMTPWRMLLVEGARAAPDISGIIADSADPLLRVVACTGAPDCAQGLAATRKVARALAPKLKVGQALHVSGCSKGCAHPKPSGLTVTATAQGFDLIRDGRASDFAQFTGLTPDDMIKAL